MNFLDRIRRSNWIVYWPVALIAVICVACWAVQRHHRLSAKNAALEHLLFDCVYQAEEQAGAAFTTGDFRQAGALLEAVTACPDVNPTVLLLHARTLECLGRFQEGAVAYIRLEGVAAMQVAAGRGRRFCERMASERRPGEANVREQYYLLHAELMQRGDAGSAQVIARKLLPDVEPLRASTVALLKQLDREVLVKPAPEPGRLDITIRKVNPKTLALLRDLKIGTLSVSRCGLDAPKILAALDVQSLDLSYNGLSDLNDVRALPLRRLQLNDTRTGDLRPLAGMPLRELNLAHTMIGSVGPLAMCPLEKLNISFTAVRDLEPLRGLELRELDLSNSRVIDLSALSGMPLEHLILTGTGVRSLKPLAGARLKSLSLAGTAVKDLAALSNMPLVKLDLRGCELLGDLEALATFKQLEVLYLPRHVQVPADRWGLTHVTIFQTERMTGLARR